MKKNEDRDILYLVPLKNGGMMSMTREQMLANKDKIMEAKPGLAPEYQAIIDKKKSFRGKNEQKPGEE